MVESLVYFTVFLVVVTILLLALSSVKGMIISKGNMKKMLLKTIPILICVAPCLIILGASLYNMLLMMFGSESIITIKSDLEQLCCTAGTWISGVLIGFAILVILMGTIFKFIKRRSLI